MCNVLGITYPVEAMPASQSEDVITGCKVVSADAALVVGARVVHVVFRYQSWGSRCGCFGPQELLGLLLLPALVA